MRILSSLLLCLAFLPFHLLPAQKFTISGQVLEEYTGEPVVFSTVRIKDQAVGTISDYNAQFKLENIEWDPNSILLIQATGYYDVEMPFPKYFPTDSVWNVNIQIKPVPPDPTMPIYRIYEQRYAGEMDNVQLWNRNLQDNASLAPVFNSVPGVRWDERGPGGSRRISMRGSLLRSPFGVRNIKAYWGNAPLTSPDGSTAAELMDPLFINGVRLLKGPDGSQFGAGTGGTMQLTPSRPYNISKKTLGIGLTGGAYGYFRGHLIASRSYRRWGFQLGYVHQQHAGYREQEANRKDMAVFTAYKHTPVNKVMIQAILYDGEWELPGALDSMQVRQDPRQANPFSLAGDAHVRRRRLRGHFGHAYDKGKLKIESGLYANRTGKTNPYATSPFNAGYKLESAAGFGGRTAWRYEMGEWKELVFGTEFQAEWQDLEEYENAGGDAGALLLENKTRSVTHLQYAGLDLGHEKNFLALRVSRNHTSYQLDEIFSADTLLGSGPFSFPTTWLPSLMYTRRDPHSWKSQFHVKVSAGYAPPTLWELQANAGLPGELRAERAGNIELRYQKESRARQKSRFRGEVQAYGSRLQDAILPQVQPSGRTTFENKGETQHLGIEGLFSLKRSNWDNLHYFTLDLTAAYQRYTFLDYAINGADYAGNRIPGIPSWTANLDLRSFFADKFIFRTQFGLFGDIPVDDANTTFQRAYTVWDARFDWNIRFASPFSSETRYTPETNLVLFVGVRNILATQYTGFLQLNGFGGRYWNPANPRTAYLGINLDF